MPWNEATRMSLRKEFILLATAKTRNLSLLCERFGISRKTGYKWLKRFEMSGAEGLAERSRRPLTSPGKTPDSVEEMILELRRQHPAWGGRKLLRRLHDLGVKESLPAPSTVTAILKRHGLIDPAESVKHQAWTRFEADFPNDLWQMDFKGPFETTEGRCYPLTIMDDHSRFNLCLKGCLNQQEKTVREQMISVFRVYGLPRKIIVDNGSPWGSDNEHRHTQLTVWWMRQGIAVSHSRPYHPQTLGKDERFHRTLKAEILQYCRGMNWSQCQKRMDEWRRVYNTERPHEALNMDVPVSRYGLSPRPFREKIEEIEYGPEDQVRKVQQGGEIFFRNQVYRISKAFYGQKVAFRPTAKDGLMDVFFCSNKIAQIDLKATK